MAVQNHHSLVAWQQAYSRLHAGLCLLLHSKMRVTRPAARTPAASLPHCQLRCDPLRHS